MPTVPSAAATELAAQLRCEGFDVSGVGVQRWRESRLLGDWQVSRRGSGTIVVPSPDAYGRARMAARLTQPDRSLFNVCVLAWFAGVRVPRAELGPVVFDFFERTRQAGRPADNVELDDHVAAMVNAGARRNLREGAARLAGTSHPDGYTAGERAWDATTGVLAAMLGDSSLLPAVAVDVLRLGGFDEVVDAAGYDDPQQAAVFGADLETMLSLAVGRIERLAVLSAVEAAAAYTALRAMATAESPRDPIGSFAASLEPVVAPEKITGLAAGFLLLTVALPEFMATFEAAVSTTEDRSRPP